MQFRRILTILFSFLAHSACADVLNLAVASNFIQPARELSAEFEEQSGHSVKLIVGSTGKHFAQIQNGAPFDLFLSADEATPQRLIELHLAEEGTSFTYAIGKLALWSPGQHIEKVGIKILKNADFRFLSIANPKLAPYGEAARQLIDKKELWGDLKGKVVKGENINQTYRFVSTGNAQAGLVAYSQVRNEPSTSVWLPPQNLYEPIKQNAVIIRVTSASRHFAQFLQTTTAENIIRKYGYDLP